MIASTLDAREYANGDGRAAIRNSVPGNLEGIRVPKIIHLDDNDAVRLIERSYSGLARVNVFIC
jgi:hypothetical protein